MERVHIALDYFNASVNRVAAWTVGFRNLQKALLAALLQPAAEGKAFQDGGNFTKLMVLQEELKTAPFGEAWDEYCRIYGIYPHSVADVHRVHRGLPRRGERAALDAVRHY